MIDLFTSPTPNGWKATIALEELAVPYALHTVDLSAGEQHRTDFLSLNLNGRIPVIVDREEDNFTRKENCLERPNPKSLDPMWGIHSIGFVNCF